ncbi:MAG: hypothetical protein ACRDLE_06305 [Gaiellaceae bacterium]
MRAQRRSYQEHGRRLARERGARYAAGCMLYWAEGAKRRNSVKITNSEPELLAFFADFLRSELDVPSSAMRLSCKSFRRPRRSTRIVQTIYGSIQEYGGFDRPAWLD